MRISIYECNYEARKEKFTGLIMEKINNYTPGPWKEINNDTRSVWFGVQGSNGKRVCNCRNHNDAKLIVTLYEQHFKMLEALKHLTANGGLIKAVYDAGENSLLFESYEKALQTIKECEL